MDTRATSLLVAVLLAGGCRTPPFELPPGWAPDQASPLDQASLPDLASPDLLLAKVCRNVYVLDTNEYLSSFDTQALQFEDLGKLNCPDNTWATPDSMAIARDGTAWAFYDDDELFHIDLATLDCAATGFDAAALNSQLVGMGFSADQPGGSTETLFVALEDEGKLAKIDRGTMALTRLAPLAAPAELTGTAAAELWGFFPSLNTKVARINKHTGALDDTIYLPQIQVTSAGFAFAFWGGSFWIFLFGADTMGDTTVYQLDAQTQALTTVLSHTGRHIVGAGVSSCAPLGLDR